MLRELILAAAGNQTVKKAVAGAPISREVVSRFVAGERIEDAVRAARELAEQGLSASLDHLGEDTTDLAQAVAATETYVGLIERLAAEHLTPAAEVSIKLSAIGQGVDPAFALARAREVCAAADRAGTTVTLDMEDHTTTDSTLDILQALRKEFPGTGAVVQSYLRRTESDCAALTAPGSRVRLCKGAYAEPDEVAFQDKHDVDLSYVRCLNVLMAGKGRPMVATHDPRLIAIAAERAARYGRMPESWEYQMLYGTRPTEQKRLVDLGHTVRVYVPFGQEWYGYLMRRLAERPANVSFFLRAVATKG
ncbi:MAG: proline dehydrogenase family protein [Actinomycetota bacterium]|jgi:proline dehydrogenase|nr:proline dehydrogenase family protein [Actinomycetota bacterium]